jgi:hypothetical protein
VIVWLQERSAIIVTKHSHCQVVRKRDIPNKLARDIAVGFLTWIAPPTLIVPRRKWVIVGGDDEVVIIRKEIVW